jgi:chromosome segregation ATPase
MTKLVHFLGRKPASATEKPAGAPAFQTAPQSERETAAPMTAQAKAAAAPDKGDIELDHELFFPIATQLGQENEIVRNLLLDAEHKIGELEIIKRSIGKLVDPVTKTLRAYEESKSEKLSLQGVLNNTRVAYNKLRDDLGASEKKAAAFEAESVRLKDVLSVAQQTVAALEQTKADQLAELASRRTHIAELQRHAQQQGADLESARNENLQLGNRIIATDKRAVQLEGQAQAAQQKALQADQERAAVQASLDKALSEFAQTARRLNDTEKTLTATQARLKTVEAGLAEAQGERVRLSAALDEANQKHLDEMSLQNSRFDALKARASMTEGLLEEARQTLMARADEIRTFERRVIETSTAHTNADEKLSQALAALAERDMQIKDFELSHRALTEQSQMLSRAVATREAAYNNAQQKIQEQSDLVELLEKQIHASREANEMQLQQLNAQLQRERLERSMAEGALESGRKDVARLLREIAALQYRPVAASAGETAATQANLRSAA